MLIAILIILLLFGGGGYFGYRGGYYGGGGVSLLTILLILLLLGIVFGGGYAWADDNSAKVAVLPFYQAIEPYLLTAFGVIFSALLGWGLTQLQTRTGIAISDDARNKVQTAAMNAAGRILAAQEGNLATVKFDVRSPAIAAEIPKIQASVGGAVKQLGMTPDRISDLIAAKIGVLQAQASSVPPTVVVK